MITLKIKPKIPYLKVVPLDGALPFISSSLVPIHYILAILLIVFFILNTDCKLIIKKNLTQKRKRKNL